MEEGELRVLIDAFMEDCVMMDRTTQPDGIGGFTHVWKQGAAFQAAIVKDNTTEALVAEKQGVTEVYTVTFAKSVPMEYHDVFKRLSDCAVFRATSNVTDSKTPKVASFQFGQVRAERWELV